MASACARSFVYAKAVAPRANTVHGHQGSTASADAGQSQRVSGQETTRAIASATTGAAADFPRRFCAPIVCYFSYRRHVVSPADARIGDPHDWHGRLPRTTHSTRRSAACGDGEKDEYVMSATDIKSVFVQITRNKAIQQVNKKTSIDNVLPHLHRHT